MPEFILSILAVIRAFLRSRSDTALEKDAELLFVIDSKVPSQVMLADRDALATVTLI